MAARKSTKSTGVSTSATPGRDEKRAETMSRNASLTIDFGAGRSADEIRAMSGGGRRSLWTDRLAALRAGVEAGEGEFDTLYKIGEFGNAHGARTVIRSLSRRAEQIPGNFDLEPVVVKHDGAPSTSELWAGVVSQEALDADAEYEDA